MGIDGGKQGVGQAYGGVKVGVGVVKLGLGIGRVRVRVRLDKLGGEGGNRWRIFGCRPMGEVSWV